MPRHANTWRRLVAAIVVAAGVGVVWGMAGGWLMTLVSIFFPSSRISEQLNIAIDGTPVISVTTSDAGGISTLNRRTLDGNPWSNDYELWLYGTSLRRFELPPGVIQFPIPWASYGERLAGGSDGKKPPTSWYVVSADPNAERFYFAGFDPFSKLPVGYIGSAGFRITLPPGEEQFANPANTPGRVSDRVASTQYLERYGLVRYHDLSSYDRPAQWLFFVLNDGDLWEVNLRDRTSHAVMKVPDSISLSMLSTLESIITAGAPAADEADGDAVPAVPIPADDSAVAPRRVSARVLALQHDTFRALPPITGTLIRTDGAAEPPKYRSVVAIRTLDSVILYDTESRREWKFKLPERIRPDTSFSVYWLNPDTMLLDLHVGHWENGSVTELLWFTADGKVQREERVELQGYTPPPERARWWALTALMPELLGWLGATIGVDPFWRLQHYKAETYTAALQQTMQLVWPMVIIVLALSVAAAGIAVHWQRKYFRSHTGVWAAFVFLFGVPGLIAYWLEHRSPKLDACRECGHVVPRDRDACASCSTPFPAAPHVETEIFA